MLSIRIQKWRLEVEEAISNFGKLQKENNLNPEYDKGNKHTIVKNIGCLVNKYVNIQKIRIIVEI